MMFCKADEHYVVKGVNGTQRHLNFIMSKGKNRFRRLTYTLVDYGGNVFRHCRLKCLLTALELGSNKHLEDFFFFKPNRRLTSV